MTNEEFNLRIEKLTERHEALTQSVEHLAIESAKHDAQIAKNSTQLSVLMEAVEHLVTIVESHQQRLDDLEE